MAFATRWDPRGNVLIKSGCETLASERAGREIVITFHHDCVVALRQIDSDLRSGKKEIQIVPFPAFLLS